MGSQPHRRIEVIFLVALALGILLGSSCGEEGDVPEPFAGCVEGRSPYWDDGLILHRAHPQDGPFAHPAYGPWLPSNRFRCASPPLALDHECPTGRARYFETAGGQLWPWLPAWAPTAVRCVGPARLPEGGAGAGAAG